MSPTAKLIKTKADLLLRSHAMAGNEVLELLGTEFPAMNQSLEKVPDPHNVYRLAQCFADHTKMLIRGHRLAEVKRCFVVADKILAQGNAAVQNAIENVFLFSVSSVAAFNDEVRKLLPQALKTEYRKQINAGGI